MAFADDLEAAAAHAAALAGDGHEVAAVLAAEAEPGDRAYLVALHGQDAARRWVVLDAAGRAVGDRTRVREAVSIAALCELAEETAAGGDLDELLSHLAALRVTENLEGIDEAEEAVRALQRTIGVPPKLATPARLDELGTATRRLEQALDPTAGSPFAAAMRGAAAVVDELVREVEGAYLVDLR